MSRARLLPLAVVGGVVLLLGGAVLAVRPATSPPVGTSTDAGSSPAAASSPASAATGAVMLPSTPVRDGAGEQTAAIRLRGCGWFSAYDPAVILALNAELARGALPPPAAAVLDAAVTGDIPALRQALSAGGPPDIVVPGFDYTPLTAVVAARCDEGVEALLDAGARPGLAPPGREPPLVLAVLFGDARAAGALVAAGADPDALGVSGSTPRELADVLGDAAVQAALDNAPAPVITVTPASKAR